MSGPNFDLSAISAAAVDSGVEVIADNYNDRALWYAPIVKTVSTDAISHPPLGHKTTTVVFGAAPRERLDGAEIQATNAGQGYTPQIAAKLYSAKLVIPERQVRAVGSNPKAMIALFAEWQRNFVRNAINTKSSLVAKKLVNGGKTAGDVTLYDDSFLGNVDPYPGKGYDGVSWFNSSHPLAQATATVKSNTLGASGVTLNTTNLDAGLLRQTVTNAVDEAGNAVLVNSRTLVVPQALRSNAIALLDSPQLPGGNYNDVNAWASTKTGINWISSSFLDQVSATAWFLVGDLGGLVAVDSGAPEFRTWYDEETKSLCHSGEFSFGFGMVDFRDVVAANVATS